MKLQSMMDFVVEFKKARAEWCYSYHIFFPDKNFIGNYQQIFKEAKTRREEMFGQARLQDLGISELQLLQKDIEESLDFSVGKRFEVSSRRSEKLKKVVYKFMKIFEAYKNLPLVQKYGLNILSTSNLHRKLNVIFLDSYRFPMSSLYKPFKRLMNDHKQFRKHDLSLTVVRTYNYRFVQEMQFHQIEKFNEAMRMYKQPITRYELFIMDSVGIKSSRDECYCNKKWKSCVPCHHMIYKLLLEYSRKTDRKITAKTIELLQQDLKDSGSYFAVVEKNEESYMYNAKIRERFIREVVYQEFGDPKYSRIQKELEKKGMKPNTPFPFEYRTETSRYLYDELTNLPVIEDDYKLWEKLDARAKLPCEFGEELADDYLPVTLEANDGFEFFKSSLQSTFNPYMPVIGLFG